MASSASPEAGTPRAPGSIGLLACVAFGVGTTVGGGVFTLSGTAVNLAGPAAVLSYILAGIVMFLCALSFIVVSTRAADGESGYAPVGTILGPFWRFIVMWAFYLNGATIIAYLVASFGDYFSEYFLPAAGTLVLALAATVLVTLLNLGPTSVVARAETWIVGIKLALLVLFAVWGLTELRPEQLERPLPSGTGGVFSAAALLFTAYTGFNVITNMAGSVKDPRRTVPRAILLTILVSGLVYLGTVLAMTASGITFFTATGVSQAAEAVMGSWGGLLVAFAACLSTLSGANANVLGASEIMLRMVARGDVPPALGRHTGNGHPYVSVAAAGHHHRTAGGPARYDLRCLGGQCGSHHRHDGGQRGSCGPGFPQMARRGCPPAAGARDSAAGGAGGGEPAAVIESGGTADRALPHRVRCGTVFRQAGPARRDRYPGPRQRADRYAQYPADARRPQPEDSVAGQRQRYPAAAARSLTPKARARGPAPGAYACFRPTMNSRRKGNTVPQECCG